MSKPQKGTCTLSHYIFLEYKVQLIKCEWVNLHMQKKWKLLVLGASIREIFTLNIICHPM